MIILTSFLVLTVQQVVNGEISKHCYTHPKVNAEDLVRTINESPEPTWKVRNNKNPQSNVYTKYDSTFFGVIKFFSSRQALTDSKN